MFVPVKARSCLLALIMLAGTGAELRAGQPGAGPVAEFWNWFEGEAARLRETGDDEDNREAMAYWLGRIRPGLSYEILRDGRKAELVLSADGQVSLFGTVAAVARAAPKIRGWKVTALRPRKRELSVVRVGDIEIDPQATWFDLYQDGPRLGVVFYVSGYRPEMVEDYRRAARILMCQAVGERNVGNEVGFVDLDNQDVRDAQFSRPFADFRVVFNGLRR